MTPAQRRGQPFAMRYLVAVSFIWAFSFPLIKTQLTDLDATSVAFIRLALSSLIFLPFLRRLPARRTAALMALGAVQFGLMYVLYIRSYTALAAHQVAVLTMTTPLFVVFFARFRDAHLHWRNALSAILAILASLILVANGTHLSHAALEGVILLQTANACFALGQVMYRSLAGETAPDRSAIAWMYIGALAAPLVALFTPLADWTPPSSQSQVLTLLYLGIAPTGLGFYLWNKGARAVTPGLLSVANNLKIPLGVLAAWLIFGESLNGPRLLGSVLAFTAAFAVAKRLPRPSG